MRREKKAACSLSKCSHHIRSRSQQEENLRESLSLERCRRRETETGEVVFLHHLPPLGFHAPPPARLS